MKKMMVYLIPILLFIILTICRNAFNLNATVYNVLVLFIVLLIPILRLMFSKTN
ncbi:TRAP-type uncharacterized transport system fused permease subunit [Amphibacillus cookii]|nr:TRAP-type uncharacterized transport system fused permease subunit [Amphibacillus cookii]